MEQLGWNDLLTVGAALLGLCGALAAVWKGVEAARRLTRADEKAAAEAAREAALAELKRRVERCEARLAQGDAQFSNTREDMTQMLTVLNALLMHFISGNDHEKLRRVKEGLDNYLSGR